MRETVLAWHFLPDSGNLAHVSPPVKVEVGETYSAKGRIVLCSNGMHGCERALDALSYAPGSIVSRVELSGTVKRDSDKYAATHRKVLWLADATTTLHEYSAWAAEWILDRLEAKGYKIDPRSRAAVAAKRAWLRGEITDRELDAAGDAAWDAAWAAAGAAAWDAAWDAAWAAAGAAARAAAGDALNAELTERLEALAERAVAS